MSRAGQWLLVINPSAGRGRGARLAPRLRQLLDRAAVDAQVVLSEYPGNAAELAREGARKGVQRVAAVGGDGTAHEVVNGLAAYARDCGDDARLASLARLTLAIVPIGTGNDWARSLGAARSLEASIARLAHGRTRPCDLGRVHYQGPDGPASRVFVNVAGAGFDGYVLERLAGRKTGQWAYLAELLRSHRRFEPPMITVRAAGTDDTVRAAGASDAARASLAVFACLGSHCGGGMRMAPGARLDDGLVDVTQVGAMTGLQLLWELRRLFDGTLHDSRHVRAFTTPGVEIDSTPASAVEADGELLGLTPARVEVLPAAIRVACD